MTCTLLTPCRARGASSVLGIVQRTPLLVDHASWPDHQLGRSVAWGLPLKELIMSVPSWPMLASTWELRGTLHTVMPCEWRRRLGPRHR
jgi:hypothetical protein